MAMVPGGALATDANSNHAAYLFLAGTGTTSPPFGPDVATAPNGNRVAVVGSGTFMAGPNKTVSGSGTYTIKNASGTTLASGTWTATQVLGFVSYGNGTPQGFPPNLFGGQLKVRVSLSSGGSGVLTVTCLLGSPPTGAMEGVTLVLGQGVGMEFTATTSGQTVFIRM
jgi:hypothetical protein